jgi:DNA-binding beta-propeller fold protein YncE
MTTRRISDLLLPLCVCVLAGGWLLSAIACAEQATSASSGPDKDYLVYIVCEGADRIVMARFGPGGLKIDHQLPIGTTPHDINGPHGIAVSKDKQFYYVSLGHGRPYGSLWKYSTDGDKDLGHTTLGYFPATTDVTPDGGFVYTVNFNLHGDMVPSSVSVVAADSLIEVRRIPTCTMPHGSRFNPQGTKHYSVCMMDDMLVEIDTGTFKVSRYFVLTKGKEAGKMGSPADSEDARKLSTSVRSATHDMQASHSEAAAAPAHNVTCSPTWAQPSSDGSNIYVACNKSNEILEINTNSWIITRRFPAGNGVYNLAASSDGRLLVATNKKDQSASIFDLKTGKELARIPTKRKLVHGAAISPDNRYAFITVEGVGEEPGTLQVIDLATLKDVGSLDLPPQAAGIDFFRVEAARTTQ